MMHQIKSFTYAFKGIWYCITHEGHFRFHLVATAYVIFFGVRFYSFTPAQWGVLMTLIALVLSMEILNTAIERLCDKVKKSYDDLIRIAKDVAAGAVLFSALAAIGVAVVFYWNIETFKTIFNYYTTNIPHLIALIASAVLAVLFIALCKSKDKRK
ncbi:MAG: diacylglycerol kinase family protein [Ruminococcus sp.]|nr:diacylglycerol kinase family protein [Ruminococcus sp.]